MLRQMLERAGYEVVDAANGREGLQHYQATAIDLIITDILMPDQDGLETILELRRLAPEAKIIAISGGGQSGLLDLLPIAEKLGGAVDVTEALRRWSCLRLSASWCHTKMGRFSTAPPPRLGTSTHAILPGRERSTAYGSCRTYWTTPARTRLACECGGINGWRTHLGGAPQGGRCVALLRTRRCSLHEGGQDRYLGDAVLPVHGPGFSAS